jgi:hypothetical protein
MERIFGMRFGVVVLLVAVVGFSAFGVSYAGAATFGDGYGAAPINGHPDAIQQVPALEEAPGVPARYAFWAGACDRALAPGFGEEVGAVGNGTGFGARRDHVLAGTARVPSTTAPITGQVPVPAAKSADHCLDWGAQTLYKYQLPIWQSFPWDSGMKHDFGFGNTGQPQPFPGAGCTVAAPCDYSPAWRLPALTQAGGHPDGTTMLAWNRLREDTGSNSARDVDGSVDNVVVDLPPGFVANPQAVARCSNEQFGASPIECPPASQVGVLRLNIESALCLSLCNLGQYNYDTTYPVFNLEPREGRIGEIGVAYLGDGGTSMRLVGKARTSGDFGVTAFAGQVPAALVPIAQAITLWGVPWSAENDKWRPKLGHKPHIDSQPDNDATCRPANGAQANEYIPPGGLPNAGCEARYESSWGPIRPFLSNETDCNPAPAVRLSTDSFQRPGAFTADGDPDVPPFPGLVEEYAGWAGSNWETYRTVSPATTGCEDLEFEPGLELAPTSRVADDPSGLDVELSLAQNNDPPAAVAHDPGDADDPSAGAPGHWRSQAGLATAHLKDSVVSLPVGMSLNPAGATGLRACGDGQISVRGFDNANGRPLFNNGDPFNKDGGADGAECPDSSKVGSVEVDTPLLGESLTGEVVLGEPKSTNPTSGEMFRMFVVARNRERGLIAKIYGSAVASPKTGRLTATFANNPEVPFSDLRLSFKGGQRGLLATPPTCGTPGWASTLTPWSAAHGANGAAVGQAGAFEVSRRCSFAFGPVMDAGVSTQQARASGVFSMHLTRHEGQQTVGGVSVGMPAGLLASVRGVPLCTAAAAASGGCPAGSRIGSVDGAAGSGIPFVLERKGSVFLTEGYKGAPFGLSVVVPVEAGPFRGAMALDPIVVRAALHIDRRTARVRAVSDPLPQVWHGIPLRLREVLVSIDRPGFMRNPSDCSPKRIVAELSSPAGATATPESFFQAAGCSRLGFKPRLGMRLTGRRQVRSGRHPGVRARVRQGAGQAAIARARVVLPKTLALDPSNARALCEFEDGTKPDLEAHCPAASVVGRATAVSPLLNRPLRGRVFFVKNVRIDPDTGNAIRTLPMIAVALRGEIAVNLYGESSVRGPRLVTTFKEVPDAPVRRFALNLAGGRNGILVVTETRRGRINLCKGRQIARSGMRAHNGRAHNRRVKIKTPCAKKRKHRARRHR